MTPLPRRKTLITGGAGGMGRACARLLGATDDLILADVNAASLDAFADELRRDSYNVTTHAGDMANDAVVAEMIADLGEAPFAVIHTAGLSPSLSDWRTIMQVNLVATVTLLDALESALVPGSVAVLIASSAGHMMPAVPEIDALLADPLAEGFLDRVGATIEAMGGANSPGGEGGISYTLSKRAVHTLVQRRAQSWGPRGCRIVSISPGIINTPMGEAEMAHSPGAKALLDATPLGDNGGMPMDIALAARFLASNEANFISGTDLLVDGGGAAGMKLAMAARK